MRSSGALEIAGVSFRYARFFLCFARRAAALLARVIHVGLAREQNFRDRHERVALRKQVVEDCGQRLGRVFAGVVGQDDAAALHLARHALRDLIRTDAFPVETVPNPNNLKPLQRKG